jgi:hypothetical protein
MNYFDSYMNILILPQDAPSGHLISEAKDMDVTTAAFWLSSTGLFVAGLICLVFAFYTKVGRQMGKVPKWIGYILIALSLLGFLGIYVIPSSPAAIVNPVQYDVAVTESESFVSVNSATHTISWLVSYNTTSNAADSSSADATINCTVQWASGALEDSSVLFAMGSSPMVSSASPGNVVQENVDHTYYELWTKANGYTAYESVSVLVPFGDGTWATCLITLEDAAGAALHTMTTGEIYPMSMTLAGESWTINFIAYNIHA